MQNPFSVSAHWNGGFNEDKIGNWAADLRAQLGGKPVHLGLVFMAPKFFPHARALLEILQLNGKIPLLAGCSSSSLVWGDREEEESSGFVLGLYSLPGAHLKAFHVTQEQVSTANGPAYWRDEIGLEPADTNGWLAFADPFHLDSEALLQSWNETYAGTPVLGGLASGEALEQRTQLYLNQDVHEEGAILISVGGEVALASLTSQGCTPIGETWTLTRVDRNVIQQIANKPAYEVLAETFQKLSAEEQQSARGNLFIGLVMNEYLEDFHRGDFLVRNLLAADPNTGYVVVGAYPRAGQTIQFQRRSARAASEDMTELLDRCKTQLGSATIYGGCLCCCNGRGTGLFGQPHHDAHLVQEKLGPLGLTGFFCNGEIGPVGGKNFLHGYTASLALFVPKPQGQSKNA